MGCEKNLLITVIALVFVVLKHSVQRRGEIHLYLGPVPEFLLVNSGTRRFSMAVGFERLKLTAYTVWPLLSAHVLSSHPPLSGHFSKVPI